jgi:16S rRNA (guanine527-N7)-methyltransferase
MTILRQGLAALAIHADENVCNNIEHYLHLLQKWNKIHNLTAVRDPEQRVIRHVLDSLSVLPHVRGQTVLDIGTGAGLPALLWALVRPDLHCTLLDGNGKKVRFLTQVQLELKLVNVQPIHQRIEQFKPAQGYDCIVSRAYTDLARFYQQSQPLLAHGGQILAMKGQLPHAELAALTAQRIAYQTEQLHVPYLVAARHLIVIKGIPPN